MTTSSLAGGGALAGVMATLRKYIQTALGAIVSLVIQRIGFASNAARTIVLGHLDSQCQASPFYDKTYSSRNAIAAGSGRMQRVAFEKLGYKSMLFWHGIFPVLYLPRHTGLTLDGGFFAGRHTETICGEIYFIRGTFNIDAIIETAAAASSQTEHHLVETLAANRLRFFIRHIPDQEESQNSTASYDESTYFAWYERGDIRLLSHAPADLAKGPQCEHSALDRLIFPAAISELIQEIVRWKGSEAWYRQRGIPWKRGWCLYGQPGTGKTALVRAFAEDLNMPVYVYNLAELDNEQFLRNWRDMQANTPCIALIEDIDNVFHGRDNVCLARALQAAPAGLLAAAKPKPNGKTDQQTNPQAERMFKTLTFDCLLNCLDGVERAEGVFTIITTNDASKLDPALAQPRARHDGSIELLASRPGRIDKTVELGCMDTAGMRAMAQRVLKAYPVDLEHMLAFLDAHPDLHETPAQFQERCAQIALQRYWEQL